MKTRTLTGILVALVYASVLLLTIYVHKVFFDVFVLLLMPIAGLEVAKAIGNKFAKPIDIFIILTSIGGYLAFKLIDAYLFRSSGVTIYFGVWAVMLIACIVYCMISKNRTMANVTSTLFVLVYPVTILFYMLGLNYLPRENFNVAALLLLVLVSSFTDTFAYFFGALIKGPKLCPSISPKKTVAGALGGILGGIFGAGIALLFSVYGFAKTPMLSSDGVINILHYLLIGMIGSIFTQLGDIVASYVKRQCAVKDFGRTLPGHGGIMDRIDGMILNTVFIYVYLTVLAI
ncbi:MAG: phosphatidate cytidylyltransferase [Clostridiales bacterium]|jgi:phosphatidate cytidylyltransferase|nr:phosphatidate cytidylyltransferase [Clostridiales bacterium]